MSAEELEQLRRENAALKEQLRAQQAHVPFNVPMAVMADSYKAGHFLMYPAANFMTAYGEFREPFPGMDDNRFVFYGIRHLVENYIARQWTVADVTAAEAFYSQHNAGHVPYPFPKDLFLKFIAENNGYFPIVVEALPEGTVAYTHTPVFIISAEGEYSRLVTFMETLLTMVWYPSCVATLSRYLRDRVEDAFNKSVDDAAMFLLDSRLHDFGFRGCTSVEQSIVGGSAHLLNFSGSDTMSAAYHVQFALNGGKSLAESIPATEHSVMTAWKTEEEAMFNEIKHFGHALFACVMDSYDYTRALNEALPTIKPAKDEKGGFMVLRPDSGDPTATVLEALRAAEKTFGCDTNSKGYKVLRGVGVIQGDGVDYKKIVTILNAVLEAGYSAQNVAFGMGGGLLQKMNRDTMSFATKLSFIEYAETGEKRDVMKTPKTDGGKFSLPGRLGVSRPAPNMPPVAHPLESPIPNAINTMRVVYNKAPVANAFEGFEVLRERVAREWAATPKNGEARSPELLAKAKAILDSRKHSK